MDNGSKGIEHLRKKRNLTKVDDTGYTMDAIIRGGRSSDTRNPLPPIPYSIRMERFGTNYVMLHIDEYIDRQMLVFDEIDTALVAIRLFHEDWFSFLEKLKNGELYKDNCVTWRPIPLSTNSHYGFGYGFK